MNNSSLAQRLTIVIAGIGALALAYLVLKNHDDPTVHHKDHSTKRVGQTIAPPTTQQTEKEPKKRVKKKPPLLTGSSVQKLTVQQGETVRFRAKAPQDEEVHIHGYDIMRELQANTPVSVQFKATLTGVFEIEFERSKKQIAKLIVTP